MGIVYRDWEVESLRYASEISPKIVLVSNLTHRIPVDGPRWNSITVRLAEQHDEV